MSSKKKTTPECGRTPAQIVKDLREMDKRVICGKKPTIFKEAADLIEKQDPKIEPNKLITS